MIIPIKLLFFCLIAHHYSYVNKYSHTKKNIYSSKKKKGFLKKLNYYDFYFSASVDLKIIEKIYFRFTIYHHIFIHTSTLKTDKAPILQQHVKLDSFIFLFSKYFYIHISR
jgi:hypothetical protein